MLTVDGIHTFYGKSHILHGVSLEVRPGEVVGLLGRNGVGKSTTLKTIMGLVHPSEGRITFDGKDIAGAAPHRLARVGIAWVPEERRIFRLLSVLENLRTGLDRPEVTADKREALLEKVYRSFPILRERRNQDATTLSGGEQQMCAIGRGIMSRPKLLMIDELSLGLAPRLIERLSEALLEINRNGPTILLVEQDVVTAFEIARHALIIETGRVSMTGTTQVLADNPAIRQAYLGM
jgi:branched-chain amino acid transport system ATP-binding protein